MSNYYTQEYKEKSDIDIWLYLQKDFVWLHQELKLIFKGWMSKLFFKLYRGERMFTSIFKWSLFWLKLLIKMYLMGLSAFKLINLQ